jgi:hypothetical protein
MKNALTLLLLLPITLWAQSTLQSTNFSSPALNGASIPVEVYLPDGYDPMQADYPLYVFLHGCCGNAPVAYTTLFKERLDTLIQAGLLPPLLVAFPSIQGADFGNRHIFANSSRNGLYGDAISQDLMAFMHASYAVRSGSEWKAIGGFSMGGDGAWRLGLAHPDSFGTILSHGAFPALEPFPAVFIPSFLQENGGSVPYTFSPTAGAISGIVYGVSSVWSPNAMNMPHGVDLPVKTDGSIDTSVFSSWFPIADVNTLIRNQWNPQPLPQAFYFDVGRQMPLLLPSNEFLQLQMDTLRQDGYTLHVKSLIFEEGHILSQARIDSSLGWLGRQFDQNMVSLDEEQVLTFFRASVISQDASLRLTWEEPLQQAIEVRLVDMNGRIYSRKMVAPLENETSFSLADIPSGAMVVQVRGNQVHAVRKLMWYNPN